MPSGTPNPIAQLVMDYWLHADTARMYHQEAWDKNWQLYIQDLDFSYKADWQSRAKWPKIPMMVNFMAQQMYKSLRMAGKFFVMESQNQYASRAAELLVRDAWQSRQININRKLSTNAVSALLCASCIWKVFYRNGLRVENVDPYDFWVDPTNRSRFVMHRTVRDYDELLEWARLKYYKMDAVKALQGGTSTEEETEWRTRSGLAMPWDTNTGRPEHEIIEMWGDLMDSDGKLLMKNGWIVIGDRREVLRGPEPNPYRDGRPPFVRVQPVPIPNAPYGGSPIIDIQDWAEELTQLGNVALDAVKLESIPGFEVDIHNARHPHRIKSRGIYPGVLLEKHSGAGQLITPIDKGHGTANSAINLLQLIAREMENQTSVTQFITGASGSGPDRTATEMNLKSQQSGEYLTGLADAFQDDGIGPLAEMSLSRIAQYQPGPMYRSDHMLDMLGPATANQLATMDEDARYFYLTEQHSIRGRGVSAMFTRQEDLARIMQFMQAIQMFPEYRELVNSEAFIRKLFEALHWDAEEMMLKPEEVQQKRAAIAMEQAVEAQQGPQSQGAMTGSSRGGVPWQKASEKPMPQATGSIPGRV